jgi:hypothetical protein
MEIPAKSAISWISVGLLVESKITSLQRQHPKKKKWPTDLPSNIDD